MKSDAGNDPYGAAEETTGLDVNYSPLGKTRQLLSSIHRTRNRFPTVRLNVNRP